MTWFWFWLSNVSWLITRVVFNSCDLLFCVVVYPAVDLSLGMSRGRICEFLKHWVYKLWVGVVAKVFMGNKQWICVVYDSYD